METRTNEGSAKEKQMSLTQYTYLDGNNKNRKELGLRDISFKIRYDKTITENAFQPVILTTITTDNEKKKVCSGDFNKKIRSTPRGIQKKVNRQELTLPALFMVITEHNSRYICY